METIMVVFSATSISEKIARFAIDRASRENARLLLLDVRDRDISRKVSQLTGDTVFMGSKVVDQIQKAIKDQRGRLIKEALKRIEEEAREKDVEIEVELLKRPSADKIMKIAKSEGVSTLIVQKRLKEANF